MTVGTSIDDNIALDEIEVIPETSLTFEELHRTMGTNSLVLQRMLARLKKLSRGEGTFIFQEFTPVLAYKTAAGAVEEFVDQEAVGVLGLMEVTSDYSWMWVKGSITCTDTPSFTEDSGDHTTGGYCYIALPLSAGTEAKEICGNLTLNKVELVGATPTIFYGFVPQIDGSGGFAVSRELQLTATYDGNEIGLFPSGFISGSSVHFDCLIKVPMVPVVVEAPPAPFVPGDADGEHLDQELTWVLETYDYGSVNRSADGEYDSFREALDAKHATGGIASDWEYIFNTTTQVLYDGPDTWGILWRDPNIYGTDITWYRFSITRSVDTDFPYPIDSEVYAHLGPTPPVGLSTRWRIYIIENGGHSNTSIAEIVYLDGSDNPIAHVSTDATASSSFSGSFTPNFAFDGNNATRWATANGAAEDSWAEMEFATEVTPAKVSITAPAASGAGDSIATANVEYWDGATWQVARAIIGQGGSWGSNEVRIFSIP